MMTRRGRRRLTALAAGIILFACAGLVRAQDPVQALLPAGGSLNASGCGPFGVLLQSGALSESADALVVRGSATGLRDVGTLTVSVAGDSLLFVPAVPFAAGETVTITLRGSLRRDGVPLGEGRVWTCRIAPPLEQRAVSLGAMDETTIGLGGALTGGFEHIDWAWSDLDGDLDLDGVLLTEAAGVPYLATVARTMDPQSGVARWQARTPTAVTLDNPVALLGADLDGDQRRDLVLLGLSGLQVWSGPGSGASPAGGAAGWLPFPAGFNGRALAAGDVDGDGDQDLVVIGLFGSDYIVGLNDGTGGLSLQIVTGAVAAPADKALPWPVLMTLADLDEDGRLDLVWTADFQEGGRYPVRLAAGQGDGSFAAAVVLTDREVFARGLVFGRGLDPAAAPQVLVATPDRGDLNLCAFTVNGSSLGCLTGPGLAAGAGAVQAGHLLLGGDPLAPELWWADPATGVLTARALTGGGAVQTRALGGGVAAVSVGDLDFDGDSDVMTVLPAAGQLVVLGTPGGLSAAPPGPVGMACGGTYDFGVHEPGCAEALGDITFTNAGLRPARLELVTISDAAGVFRIIDQPDDWFGGGCSVSLASATLQLGFAPTDTALYTGTLTVRLRWAGAAAGGGDSTYVCGAVLRGQGGVFGLAAGPAGPGTLIWTGAGYASSGGAFDLGAVPAEAGTVADTTITLVNAGHFAVDVTPPAAPDAPWSVDPLTTRRLLPGESAVWTVRAQPHLGLLPAGVDTLALAAELAWTVEPVDMDVCFAGAVLRQTAAITLVRPTRPDLAVLDLRLLPMPGEAAIREGMPFVAQAIVTARRAAAPGARLTLDGGGDLCLVEPGATVTVDLVEDQRDTVRFRVTACSGTLDFPISACIEPAGGMAFEFDAVDNCFTAGARLAANSAPVIVFSDLVQTPADPTLAPCDDGQTWNDLSGGVPAALGVREGSGLRVTVTASDAEGDALRLDAAGLPAFVSVVRISDAELQLLATPPVGTVVSEACQLFGPLQLNAAETAAALPETTTVAVPLYVKWEGPDLAVTLVQVPASGELDRLLAFSGRVENVGAMAMGACEITLWLSDAQDQQVAGQAVSVSSLAPGETFDLPEVAYTPTQPGRYCAHIAVTEGRDLDPDNNTAVQCLNVDAGPLVVSPNVVTPNGDGYNDRILFHMANQAAQQPRVRIYELAGALVYESTSLDGLRNLWWDGRDRDGRQVPPGSYLYVIDEGGREVAKGVCGVIR